MRFAHPRLDHVVKIHDDCVNTLVIEEPRFFRSILEDIYEQIDGGAGSCVLSTDNRVLAWDRNAEMIDSFLHFSLERKPLLTKVTNRLESIVMEDVNYLRTDQLTVELEKYIMELAMDLPCDVFCSKMSFGAILRAVGVTIVDDHVSDLERLLDYMELTRELDHERLFVLVNLRSYYSDAEVEAFFSSVLDHGFLILPIDSISRARLKNERRTTIDCDLCEF